MEILLRKGASIEAMDKDKNTPLHLAAQGGRTNAAALLIREGASTEAMNIDNKYPFQLAEEKGHGNTAVRLKPRM